ncbi:MAG TPA: paraquat-inducible protein A [Polyangia bacterium]|nr:paraquat-inducible protein A [Polyangia bacterium]
MSPVISCPECGLEQRQPALLPGDRVRCARCRTALYRQAPSGRERALAWTVTAAIVLCVALVAPLVTLDAGGTRTSTTIIGMAASLRAENLGTLAALVFTIGVLVPAFEIALAMVLLGAVRRAPGPWFAKVLRLFEEVRRWSMLEVLLVGVVVSLARVGRFAHVEVGWGLGALLALAALRPVLPTALDLRVAAWTPPSPGMTTAPPPASRGPSRALALLVAACILYLPANVLPVLETASPLGVERDTILSGVVQLWGLGAWPLALVILTASILIPLAKLLTMTFLVFSVQRRWVGARLQRTRLHQLIERIGRWSMVDVFVAAVLGKLVRFPGAATVTVEPGALAFSAVVVLTLLATHAFDPRLIWARGRSET